MTLRPHGRAIIDADAPRALAICDRCGAMVNHDVLQWQMRWRGPRLTNIRILVCKDCYDTPNEQERTVVLPIDPVTIKDPRPENYALADNPVSPLGADPADFTTVSARRGQGIGSLANINAAFDGAVVVSCAGTATPRRYPFCANRTVSFSSFQNTIGKNWSGDPSGVTLTLPSTVAPITHVVSSFTLIAPSDQPFLVGGATGVQLQGSANGVTWTTLFNGTTAGTAREIITANTTSAAPFQFHRVAFQGDGINSIAVAQVIFNVSDAAPNEI